MSASTPSPSPSPKPAVLVVDDIEANLVVMEALLAGLPCEIVRATSGNEALKQLLRREFAVMLLDVQMPGMDGFEVAHYARDNPNTRDVPIIFVTAMNETEGNVLRGYGSGAVDLLFKPINPNVLYSKVRVFIDLYLSRRRLEEEIEAHKRTLADLEAFNYSVSHDLRAPLRPLDGFSQVLLEEHAQHIDEQGKDYLRRIRNAAQRMGQLIDDLLNFSRLSRAELRRQTVDMSGIALETLAELRVNDAARQVNTVVQPGVTASGDPRLLRIVFENLLRNAWKFTAGKSPATIEFGVQPPKNGQPSTYFVRDDGVGFDAARASRLFQPFQRFHASSAFEGTGIGLAIVKRIIERHGGTIWPVSEVGAGATFFFTLASTGGRP
jgi:two-component system, sensor histidine kinase and response regulator